MSMFFPYGPKVKISLFIKVSITLGRFHVNFMFRLSTIVQAIIPALLLSLHTRLMSSHQNHRLRLLYRHQFVSNCGQPKLAI